MTLTMLGKCEIPVIFAKNPYKYEEKKQNICITSHNKKRLHQNVNKKKQTAITCTRQNTVNPLPKQITLIHKKR